MSIKETIGKIKAFLEIEDANHNATENFTDVKTNDDVILSFDGELEVGKEIFIVDESGRLPAPDGDYFVEDKKITILEGKVEAIEEVVPEEAPEEVKPEEEAPEADVPVEAEEVKAEEEAPVDEKNDVNLDELVSKIAQLESDQLEMMEIITKMAENISNKNFKEDVKMSMEQNVVKVILKKEDIKSLTKSINPLDAFAKKH